MNGPDPIEWYNRRPVWVRVLLYPALVPTLLMSSIVRVVLLALFEFPILAVRDALRSRKRWREFRREGRLLSWSESVAVLDAGGVLVVGVGANGPGYTWVIDQPRHEVDPEHALPTWKEFQTLGWQVFEGASGERIDRWAVSHDAAFRSTAPVTRATWWRVWRLNENAKAHSVLVYC